MPTADHPARAASSTQRDLFAAPLPGRTQDTPAPEPAPVAPAPALTAAQTAETGTAPPPPSRPGPREPITQEEIDSFKALGIELCIRFEELGELWLVPEYTNQDRREISPEHAATLRLLLDAFPGGRVTAFEKQRQARTSRPRRRAKEMR